MATDDDDLSFLDDFMDGHLSDLDLSNPDLSFPSDMFIKDEFIHDTHPSIGRQELEKTNPLFTHRLEHCDVEKVAATFQPIPEVFVPHLTGKNLESFLPSVYLRTEATMFAQSLCDFPTLVALHLKAYLDPEHTVAIQRDPLLLDFREGQYKPKDVLNSHHYKLQVILKNPTVRFIFCPTTVILEDNIPHALLLVLDKRREMYFFFDPHGYEGDYVKRTEAFVVQHLLCPLADSSKILWENASLQTTCLRGLDRVLQGGRPLCVSWIAYELGMCMANPDTDLGILHCAMSIDGLIRFLYFIFVTVHIQTEACIDFGNGILLKGGVPLSESLPKVTEPVIEEWLKRTGGIGPMSFDDCQSVRHK